MAPPVSAGGRVVFHRKELKVVSLERHHETSGSQTGQLEHQRLTVRCDYLGTRQSDRNERQTSTRPEFKHCRQVLVLLVALSCGVTLFVGEYKGLWKDAFFPNVSRCTIYGWGTDGWIFQEDLLYNSVLHYNLYAIL